jgi:hypothetical protein
MPETAHIQRMAELAGDSIFSVFGWKRAPLMNQNWDCEEKQKHHKLRKNGTHPTDAVFTYTDPYSGYQIYVNTDLKSYARGSLENADLAKVIREVGHAVECASKSPKWKDIYVDQTRNHNVIGLVFIYNHDGGYDTDFSRALSALAPSTFDLHPMHYVGVVGPQRVIYLNSIAADIKDLTYRKMIPEQEHCRFKFPHLSRTMALHPTNHAAPLPALLSPLLVLSYAFPIQDANGSAPGAHVRGAVAYYDGPGECIDEFKYLLDYFFKYQFADETSSVIIRQAFQHPNAPALFEKAKVEYARDYWPAASNSEAECRHILDRISLNRVQSVVPSFSDQELGMIRTQA